MIKGLRAKFIVVNMALVTVMLLIIFGLILNFTGESLKQESLTMMERIGTAPKDIFSPEDGREQANLPYFVVQMDFFGQIRAVSGVYFDLSDPEFVGEVLDRALESETDFGELPEEHLRFLRVMSPKGLRIVFADTSAEETTIRNLMKICGAVGILALLLLFGVSVLLSRWAVRPVEQAWQQQKQFLADASHELKTPLTVILTNGELLKGPDCTPEDRERFAGAVLKMGNQMRILVERLLTLARMDNNASNMEMEELNLSELAENELMCFEPVFFERGLELSCHVEENLMVRGSRDHLIQVLDILLDNAGKYAISPGRVQVELTRKGNHCLLQVTNPAPEMDREELEQIFQRFYRRDKSRARDGSTGLGLPIARSIITGHGGKLWAEYRNGQIVFSAIL